MLIKSPENQFMHNKEYQPNKVISILIYLHMKYVMCIYVNRPHARIIDDIIFKECGKFNLLNEINCVAVSHYL